MNNRELARLLDQAGLHVHAGYPQPARPRNGEFGAAQNRQSRVSLFPDYPEKIGIPSWRAVSK